MKLFENIYFRRATAVSVEATRNPGSRFRKMESTDISIDILEAIAELAYRAFQGDATAIECLLADGKAVAEELWILGEKRPALVKPIAETTPQWPVAFSPNPESLKAISEFVSKIQLGAKSVISSNRKTRWTRESKATSWALDVISTIREAKCYFPLWKKLLTQAAMRDKVRAMPEWVSEAAALPELSKASSRSWADVGKRAILEVYPINHPGLASLGKKPWQEIREALKAIAAPT